MRSKRNKMAGKLMRLIPAGVLGWALVGCDTPPDFQPVAPPGAALPRKSPDEEPAAAVGEMPASAPATVSVSEKPPALPTAKGETKTTPGGVTYETLKEGTGAELKAGQTGEFLYEGRLDNGTVFDGNMKDRRPTTFNLNKMIDGWKEGLPGMKVGEVRKLVVPSSLGYKAPGFPPKIPPNATLVFEVELVGIPAQ